jgi:tetraacyldisaccharide 4'-kinase
VVRSNLEIALLRSWSQRGVVTWLLWPISIVYRALVFIRRWLYRLAILKIERMDAIVIIVGNVIAGGAGKTPTVISITQHLTAQGLRVGIISRGYGRHIEACQEVGIKSSAEMVGDEPTLLKHATGVPVFVGRDRAATSAKLLEQYPDTQIIVSDDGMQHYGLYRDIEVCVFDDRGTGNGFMLPAGPLRESWPRIVVPCTGQINHDLVILHTGNCPAFKGYQAQRRLAPKGVLVNGETVGLASLNAVGTKPILALAGIAQPDKFFDMLRLTGIHIERTLALPDHYSFVSLPPDVLMNYTLICTEKDALKLWLLAPHAIAIPLLQTAEPSFFAAIDRLISERMASRLSSSNGH